ncbi:barnase inhibitor [Paenibacillus albicereus]|uniref:Barnase inhibitor n=1 Tax=Paenibacillus albicereus TaxID=2726185 RepID=A0A6H2GWD6_9BACL|nr:barstar family protein [Paenibacillus albicereus]QJC51717.1 barnase inhibitor [Paenibacillus albicereus]
MRELLLDGSKLHDWDDIHDWFAEQLGFPDYYGRNLDALWDCLGDYAAPPLRLRWRGFEESQARLGPDGAQSLLQLLRDAETELDGFTVVVE